MGAAAADFATPPPLRQNPPIRLEQSAVDMILQAINGMKNKMDGNTQQMNGLNENACRMEKKMDGMNANMKEEIKNGMKEEMKKNAG